MPSPTRPGTCRTCQRSTTLTGDPLAIFQSGKHQGQCRTCKWETNTLKLATTAHPCERCNRIYGRSGRTLRLHRSGKYKDLCMSCKKQLQTGQYVPADLDPGLRRYLAARRARLARCRTTGLKKDPRSHPGQPARSGRPGQRRRRPITV